jgi:putative heme-binding domain-containing protein
MLHFGHFESGLHLRFPDDELFVRNLCDEGNTPSFRPHSGRAYQLGFPGAEAFHAPYTGGRLAEGVGHFETEEEWLHRLEPDLIVAFFGFNESFQGGAGLEKFRGELDAFLKHTRRQRYDGESPAELVLVSPTAFEDRSDVMSVPDGRSENANLAAYTAVMEAVAADNGVRFVNVFTASLEWQRSSRRPLTTDGALLNDAGTRRLSSHLLDSIFGEAAPNTRGYDELVREAVREKNWFWINDFKIPNGVHVFGRRYDPFGPANYPFEVEKIRAMTAIRDEAIWAAARGELLDLAARDAETAALPPVETNYVGGGVGGGNGALTFLTGAEALAAIAVPEGYRIEQWATEQEFGDLANPVQLSFDNAGRLWVATMPSYPHYRPGDPKPNDKLLILEDTDGDGRADKQTVFADKLHLPMGFELAPEGVYLSQGSNLVLLKDTDGDDAADEREIILSGFDDHDTHHAIGAFCADPSGAIMMCEGTFLRTNVETAYGPVRGTDGGFYRFSPQRRHLERHAQLPIPNPWGVAFDDWGQHFFLHTSGPTTEWMLPGSIKPLYGIANPPSEDLIETAHRVRPTSGLEFLSSRHFPDEMQGDMLLNNCIGFLGTKQHRVREDGTGYATEWRQDLTRSTDGNYRPVDIEVAPDGSLYIVDWHNPLIGHMQHNARDPHRDHDHGRIYRVTFPGRALVVPAEIAGASIETLLANLKLPEYRSRYRTRRELRGRDPAEVLPALAQWVAGLAPRESGFEHHLLEALWVTWGFDQVDEALLRRLLNASDHRARAAAVRVLRYNAHRIHDQVELLKQAARDTHGRVKLEAIAAASWIGKEDGLAVLAEAAVRVEDHGPPGTVAGEWIEAAYRAAEAHLNDQSYEQEVVVEAPEHLEGDARERYLLGAEIYSRDGHCSTCHQPDGLGLQAAGFPPLAGTQWATGDEDRLIKLTLNGLLGPMQIDGTRYPGLVPMTPFGGVLNDEEIAAVLTFVRNSFGNRASTITAEKVAEVRVVSQSKIGFYSPQELEGGPATGGRAFVKMWEMGDFEGAFDEPLRGRSFERGREMFEAASCRTCHNIQGEGKHVGADLSHIADQYGTADLLRQILEPSLTIRDEFRIQRIVLKEGSVAFGLIVERDAETVHIAERIQEPDETVTLDASEIASITPLKTSAMPAGLLAVLSRDEILDLLAYIVANGKREHRAFSD